MSPDLETKIVPALNNARNRQMVLLKEKRIFRAKNGLERTADYPTSLLFHFSLVVAMVIIEAMANMYLFAQGNELGLLGGIFEAILLSIVNVGVSVVVGMLALPQLSLLPGARRTLGMIALIGAVIFALVFNLTAAHYRDFLIQSKEIALQQALPHTFSHPFEISFNGLVLLIIGLVVSALGMWKGFSADDPFPGYGSLTRKYEYSKQAFRELREQHPGAEYPFPGVED